MITRSFVREKMDRIEAIKKEEELLAKFNSVEPDYNVHSQIARELFSLYIKVREYDAARNIIAQVTERFPNCPHPLFRVDFAAHKIYMDRIVQKHECLLKPYLKQALAQFPDAVYIFIRTFTMGTDLFCYKDIQEGKVKSIRLYPDDSDEGELINCYKAKAIRKTHQKVKLEDMPEEEV